jgi:salicylate biosynthesis isochorismate synthase/menaquinone-specific isochorismate synthase
MKIERPLQETCWGAARQLASVDPLECGAEGSIHWEDPRLGESFFGLGEEWVLEGAPADVLELVESREILWLTGAPEVPGPWFGGIAFDPERPRSDAWVGFGAARFVLPQLSLARSSGRTWALAFVRSHDEREARRELESRLDQASALLDGARGAHPSIEVKPAAAPGASAEVDAAWRELVGKALGAFESRQLEKVVGAREIRRRLPGHISSREMARRLRAHQPSCTSFVFTGADGARFVGATPETLVRIGGGVLRTEALAGTLAPGQEQPGGKELYEHLVVVEGIRSALVESCERIDTDAGPHLHNLGALVHLRTPISANLRPEARIAHVVSALHPTPAVGGTPRAAALSFLRDHEGFDRGWYAGAVGWLGPARAHLCVGLRSALIRGDELRAFAGAGLVAGSDPEAEWIETERKAAAVLGALGAVA